MRPGAASLACNGLFQRAGPQRFSARERRLLRRLQCPGTGTKLRLNDSGFGALPRAVASCVVGGDRQRCLVAILAGKRGASKAAWLSEPETAAMGAEDPRRLPRSRPQRQRQLRALLRPDSWRWAADTPHGGDGSTADADEEAAVVAALIGGPGRHRVVDVRRLRAY